MTPRNISIPQEPEEAPRDVMIREADRLVRDILWLAEEGRCYTCDGEATDVAHLFSRRHLRLRWDVEPNGNCHLLCRTCHDADHAGNLAPSYSDTFIKKQGDAAFDELLIRKMEVSPVKDYEIEHKRGKLQAKLEAMYAG